MHAVEWPHLVAEHLLKSALVLALGFALIALLRRVAPARKHDLWLHLFAAGLAIPLLLVLPRWEILPSWTDRQALATTAGSTVLSPAVVPAAESHPVPASSNDRPPDTSPESAPAPSTLLLGLWTAGVLALLLQSIAVSGFLRRLEQKARKPSPSVRSQFERIRSAAGTERPVTLVLSPEVRSPFGWGLARPRIVLPESAERWSKPDLEMVLLHELEHVRRGDALAVLISRIFLALNWINPLAWIAHRQSVRFREEACDEGVVRRGHDSRDYADLLLRQARSASRSVLFSCATPVVETGKVEGRVRRVLASPGAPPRPAPTRWVAIFAVAVVVAIALLGWRQVAAESAGGKESEQSEAAKEKGLEKAPAEWQKKAAREAEDPLTSHEIARRKLLAALERAPAEWEKKIAGEARHPLTPREIARRKIAEKLKSIIIPTIEFHDVPLSRSLDFLERRSVELDPLGEGVRIRLTDEDVDDGNNRRRKRSEAAINMSMNHVSLVEALHYTCLMAQCEYSIEEDGSAVSIKENADKK